MASCDKASQHMASSQGFTRPWNLDQSTKLHQAPPKNGMLRSTRHNLPNQQIYNLIRETRIADMK